MIKKEIPVVINKTYNKKIYVAKDGQEFNYESDCLNHERDLDILEKMKHIPYFEEPIFNYGSWFYLSTVEDLETFKLYLRYIANKGACICICNEGDECISENFLLNNWVSYRKEYNADDADDYYLVTLNYIQEAYNKIKRKADSMI